MLPMFYELQFAIGSSWLMCLFEVKVNCLVTYNITRVNFLAQSALIDYEINIAKYIADFTLCSDD